MKEGALPGWAIDHYRFYCYNYIGSNYFKNNGVLNL